MLRCMHFCEAGWLQVPINLYTRLISDLDLVSELTFQMIEYNCEAILQLTNT